MLPPAPAPAKRAMTPLKELPVRITTCIHLCDRRMSRMPSGIHGLLLCGSTSQYLPRPRPRSRRRPPRTNVPLMKDEKEVIIVN
jgi:hypothetical protein